MSRKNWLHRWRVLNTVLIFVSMTMSWYYTSFAFDNFDSNFYSTGNPFISSFWFEWYWLILGGIANLADIPISGFGLSEAQSVLAGISGFLLVLYLIYNLLVLSNKIRDYKSQILLPNTLFIMVAMFSLELHPYYSDIGKWEPMLGFWFISSGLLSSIIFELANAWYVEYEEEESTGVMVG